MSGDVRVHPDAFPVLAGLDLQESLGFQGHKEEHLWNLTNLLTSAVLLQNTKGRGWNDSELCGLDSGPLWDWLWCRTPARPILVGSSLAKNMGVISCYPGVVCHFLSIDFFPTWKARQMQEQNVRVKNIQMSYRGQRLPQILKHHIRSFFLWAAQKGVFFVFALQ